MVRMMDEREPDTPREADVTAGDSPDAEASPHDSARPNPLDAILERPLPDALDLFLSGVERREQADPESLSGLDLFAYHVLMEARPERLRAIFATRQVRPLKLSTSESFYLAFDPQELNPDQTSALLEIEAALNRVEGVRRVTRDMDSAPSLALCAATDELIMQVTGMRGSDLVDHMDEPNPWMDLPETAPGKGGEWDLRTRFATMVERQFLPYRLVYDFRCNVSTGVFAVEYALPEEQAMPASVYDEDGGQWVETTPEERLTMATEYGLRLALMLGGAALATSVGTVLASVTARRGSLSGPVAFSLRFTRPWFLENAEKCATQLGTLPLAAPSNLPQIEQIKQAQRDANGFLPWVRFGSGLLNMEARLRRPADDHRELPQPLAERLKAKTVADLEVFSAEPDSMREAFKSAMELSSETPLLCIAQLEQLVDEYDLEHGDERANWFDGYPSRVLLPLVQPEGPASVLVPDSYYLALSQLADLYTDAAGDPEQALAIAQRTIELAPSVPRGYVLADRALAAMGRYEECVDALTRALSIACDPGSIDYLYYRLAFALWNTGYEAEAVACYSLVPVEHPDIGPLAQREMAALLTSLGMTEKPGELDARAALAETLIPLAPTAEVSHQLACAAIGLIDAGAFVPAAPVLARPNPLFANDAISSVLKSIVDRGLAPKQPQIN